MGAPAQRVRGGSQERNFHPATLQSPSVTAHPFWHFVPSPPCRGSLSSRGAFAFSLFWLKNPPNSQDFSLVRPAFPCYNKLVFANTPFRIDKEMYTLWQQRKAALPI